jgi:ABC-type Mn2+/Zn2+ transport system ATPase subunit
VSEPTTASTATTTTAVEAHDLRVAYGGQVALRDVSFALAPGTITAVIGPNGSGKTTLLKTMSGLVEPDRGRIEVFGRPATHGRGRTAHVMQSTKVNDAVPLTVVEVVRMGRYPRRGMLGRFGPADHDAVARAMDRMDVTGLARRHLSELSGGQQQRVFVAQGLAQEADLLLLDEPVTGLDVVSEERISRVLVEEAAAGRTIVMTTHDVATAADADHVLLLATHLVCEGPPDQVLTEEHLGHAYGGTAFRTAEGTLFLGDPHVHGAELRGHESHAYEDHDHA